MNKGLKTIVSIIGIGLLIYGVVMLVMPENKISFGDVSIIETQDNTNAFITMGIGIVLLIIGLSKK